VKIGSVLGHGDKGLFRR